ncbi:transmembrane protein 242 isoform X2 [Lingula anatina]|uniref:Transmembrane protein 242 n=1 Tax=Lingula anatina TaxID=7574 RepID=A0A1S3ISN3_LINAN|nr:transmembrane protein 242 isoform X1 [Lingula anatina]XP_013401220.1 transmembrane protein 242 isoform X2 [Lingula anatina]|eukprot:XP_013401219.1 transmembrane protein 242 isoform X1 [Lingula anatina]
MMENDDTEKQTKSKGKVLMQKVAPAIFLVSMGSFMFFGGFATAFSLAKKQDPKGFSKGMIRSKQLPDSGSAIASRALARATLYSFGGFGLFIFITCAVLGVRTPKEFSAKMNEVIPKAPKKESTGRNEFDSFRELFTYLEEEDAKKTAKLANRELGCDSKTSLGTEKDR